MLHLFPIALRSAWNLRLTLGVTLIAIAQSVTLLLGTERARNDAREGFSQSVSGTDPVMGAQTSPVQLMLYSVFRIGEATNNICWKSFQDIAAHPSVAWTIPLSLGDPHRGFPVLGTVPGYFEHFRYGASQPLLFAKEKPFVGGVDGMFDAVLGADVAQRLGYRLGDRIVLNHGLGGAAEHADKPFAVVGMLARTGTPVDRTVHVNLEAIEAIHMDSQGGAPVPGVVAAQPALAAKQPEPRAASSADGNYQPGDRLKQSNAPKAEPAAPGEFREVNWEALVLKNWDPMKAFKGMDLNATNDADPRAMDLLQKLREEWDNAPVERSMNGAPIRIPGFIVPLDTQRGQIKEFLLVPYFGGCIHSPPPANQIISVVSAKPLKMQTMDAVWISGVLETTRSDTSMESSGYRMKAVAVTSYVPPKSK